MDRVKLLSNLVECACEETDASVETMFSKLIHEFKSLYVFYDILKETGIDKCRFHTPIIEGDEVTYFFHVSKESQFKKLRKLDGSKKRYKKTKVEYLISFAEMDKDRVALTLSKILKG